MTAAPTCRTGKLPYASAQDAAKAARHVGHRGHRVDWHKGKLQHYHCRFCGAWHIGHTTPQGKSA